MQITQDSRNKCLLLYFEQQRSELQLNEARHLAVAHDIILRKYIKICLLFERAGPLIESYYAYLQASQQWANGQLSKEQLEAIEHSEKIKLEIEIYFESFFLYSSILCDDVAKLFLHHFGQARSIKLGTHRELSKNLRAYCNHHDLRLREELASAAIYLEKEVCDFRDKQIVHDFHPRKVDCIMYVPEQNSVALSYAIFYPKDTDKFVISRPWSELQREIEEYLWQSLNFIEENRAKSRRLYAATRVT